MNLKDYIRIKQNIAKYSKIGGECRHTKAVQASGAPLFAERALCSN